MYNSVSGKNNPNESLSSPNIIMQISDRKGALDNAYMTTEEKYKHFGNLSVLVKTLKNECSYYNTN